MSKNALAIDPTSLAPEGLPASLRQSGGTGPNRPRLPTSRCPASALEVLATAPFLGVTSLPCPWKSQRQKPTAVGIVVGNALQTCQNWYDTVQEAVGLHSWSLVDEKNGIVKRPHVDSSLQTTETRRTASIPANIRKLAIVSRGVLTWSGRSLDRLRAYPNGVESAETEIPRYSNATGH